jgi:hypothetical protein
MTLSSAQGRYGLTATVRSTGTGVSGSPSIGFAPVPISFPDATTVYVARCIIARAGDQAVIALSENNTESSDAWVAGTAQQETATIIAAGGCTENGTMTLVLTAAGLAGSPRNIAVPLTTTAHTTAALIAAAARTALSADVAVAALFTIGGTAANILLIRRATATYTIPGGTLPLFPADDATLNLAIPSGLGVTAASTSTDTTAGVATSGAYWIDGDGNDFEGEAIPTLTDLYGLLIKSNSGAFDVSSTGGEYGDEMVSGQTTLRLSDNTNVLPVPSVTVTATGGACDLTLTVLGA